MKKVTYIIPLHEYNKNVEKYFKRAIKSLSEMKSNQDNKVVLIGPESVINKAKSTCDMEVELIVNNDTDFCSQINNAVFQCITPYFSVLEFDDEYMPYWYEVSQEYGKNGASVLLPINELYKDENLVALANEIAWSPSFVNEKSKGLGYIDNDCLETFMDFNVTGALIKTEDFISVGGLKPSLKIAAWHEFLMRMAYNKKDIYVVPKIGYKHIIDREGSYMATVNLSQEEGAWLIKTAKQEYFFKEDRNKTFEKDASEV